MAIRSVYIENFKGFSECGWLPLRPVTILIGANSSGKSSCIHALAALSQTVKLPNSERSLILDDEHASVHLGRFIDVIHTNNYTDLITLGIQLDNVPLRDLDRKPRRTTRVEGEARLAFKCSKRTQDVHLIQADYKVADNSYRLVRQKNRYNLVDVGNNKEAPVTVTSGFFIESTSFEYDEYRMVQPVITLQRAIEQALTDTLYLGPFRQPPRRTYPTRGSSPTEVGPQGEAAVPMLANEIIQTRSRPHIRKISEWLRLMTLGNTLNVRRIGGSDLFDVEITLVDGEKYSVADLGYGISQALPVLVQCSFAGKGSTLLFEQPEIHLHALSAKRLATVFIETATTKSATVVIETHSPELVKEFLGLIGEGQLSRDDFALYSVARVDGESKLRKIPIEEDLDVYENWERGFTAEF